MMLAAGLVLIFLAIVGLTLAAALKIEAESAVSVPVRIGAWSEHLWPRALRDWSRHLLVLAGSPRDITTRYLLGLKTVALPIGAILGLALAWAAGWPPASATLSLFLSMLLLAFLPDLWLHHISTERQQQIRRDLPDTLDLLTINVEAGLGFDAAVMRLVENLPGSLSEEFSRLLREVQLGRSRQQALKAMMERTSVAELNSCILAIIEADMFGISIGQTLRAQSHEMRVKRRQRAEEAAIKTPVKIIFPLILCIFPTVLIVVVGPAAIRIMQTLSGVGQ